LIIEPRQFPFIDWGSGSVKKLQLFVDQLVSMQKVVVMEKLIGIRPTERELLKWSKSALKKPRPTDGTTISNQGTSSSYNYQ